MKDGQYSPRLQAAMDEIESGGGMVFDTVEELFAYLNQDDKEDEIQQASSAPLPTGTNQAQATANQLDEAIAT